MDAPPVGQEGPAEVSGRPVASGEDGAAASGGGRCGVLEHSPGPAEVFEVASLGHCYPRVLKEDKVRVGHRPAKVEKGAHFLTSAKITLNGKKNRFARI